MLANILIIAVIELLSSLHVVTFFISNFVVLLLPSRVQNRNIVHVVVLFVNNGVSILVDLTRDLSYLLEVLLTGLLVLVTLLKVLRVPDFVYLGQPPSASIGHQGQHILIWLVCAWKLARIGLSESALHLDQSTHVLAKTLPLLMARRLLEVSSLFAAGARCSRRAHHAVAHSDYNLTYLNMVKLLFLL